MLNKLSIRNARRSAKDYLVYMITMIIFAALMFAFNTMLLSKDVSLVYQEIPMMAVMLGIATFFIVIIIAWLINYMIIFMLEKRGREFGTYLLIGMKKKQISKLFFRENIIMGSLAFLLGLAFGLFLQQILMTIFYNLIDMDYLIKLDINLSSLLMTAGFYFGCYLLALWRSRRKFRKLNINNLMNIDKQNQEVNEKGDKWKQWLFFLALTYFITFYVLLFSGGFGALGSLGVFLLIIGFIFAIYLIYLGLSAFIVRYIRNKGEGIYKSGNLFLLRQFSGKIKTMPFTMGTLTVLFAFAMIGLSFAMMFSDYLDKQLHQDFPFAVSIAHEDPDYDFAEEIKLIEAELKVDEVYFFNIYQNNTNAMNTFLYTNFSYFKNRYKSADGKPDQEKIINEARNYFDYDTYMKLSDYNHLRKILGYDEVKLNSGQYLIHISNRVYMDIKDKYEDAGININGIKYEFAGFRTEGFAQDGHNGSDYIIIVPDEAIKALTPYYGRMVMEIANEKIIDLQDRVNELHSGPIDDDGNYIGFLSKGFGTKQIIVYSDRVLIRADVIYILKYILSSMLFPLFYIALVYLCVALTVLSVQQLSDSNKYKFRYAVLSKLGMNDKKIDAVILKQLLWYYLCPILTAILISAVIILFVSEIFIRYTGIPTMVFYYFGISITMLFGIYGLYFTATYVLFRRNIYS